MPSKPSKYPNWFNVRLSNEDRARMEAAAEQAEIPASTLARKILRQWLQASEAAVEDTGELRQRRPTPQS